MVIWETTIACDLACRHCRAQAIPTHDPHSLATCEGKQLLDQIAEFGKPHPIVVFTGGDPFKRDDLFELLAYGTGLGLPIAVSPSGTPLLTQENLRRLKETGAKAISLSLDGSTPAIHDAFRGVRGSFAMTLEGWQIAHAIGLKLQLNTTVTRHNLYDLPNIFKLAYDLGVMTWSVFFLVPTGRGRTDDEIPPQAYEDVMHWLYDASKWMGIKTTEGHHYKRVVLQRSILEQQGIDPALAMGLGDVYRQLSDSFAMITPTCEKRLPLDEGVRRPPLHINAGNGFVFISHRGEVFPSGFMPISAGNIRETSLVTLYRHSPLFCQLRQYENLEGKCGQCEYKHLCGGSRSRAYAMTGNPFAEEPFCIYEPGSFPYRTDRPPVTG